jgi:hypothetical protein
MSTSAEVKEARKVAADRLASRDTITFFAYSTLGQPSEPTSQEDIFTVDGVSGAVTRLTDDSANPDARTDRDPRWSPDRRRLAVRRATFERQWFDVLDARTGATLATAPEITEPMAMPSHTWLDDETLLFSLGEGVWAWRLSGGEAVQIAHTVAPAWLTDLSWHPRRGLAARYLTDQSGAGGYLGVFDREWVLAALNGYVRLVAPAPVPPGSGLTNAHSPRWSRDGHLLAFAEGTFQPVGFRVGCLNMRTGDVEIVPTEPGLDDHSPAIGPGGRLLAFSRGSEDAWADIWIYDRQTHTTRRLTSYGRARWCGGLDW